MDKGIVSRYADFSVLSFLIIESKLNRDPSISSYRNNEILNQRMPNAVAKLGYGLHLGWAIEGAIGSEFKIDVSYLSPHVGLTVMLEEWTKHYQVPLLLSSDLYQLLSPKLQKLARQVDYVQVQIGQEQRNIALYTIDYCTDDLPQSKYSMSQKSANLMQNVIKIKKKSIVQQYFLSPNFDVESFINNNKDLKLLITRRDETFQDLYRQAFTFYQTGMWQKAREFFNKALKRKTDDKPTILLLDYMEQSNWVPPGNWQGCKMAPK